MDQSTKLNQSCSPSSMQNKLFNGVQMKVNRVLDCDYCHLPCTTQKHNKSYIASLNPTKEPCSMRNSFYVPENRQTIMGSFCRQLTSSIIPPSDPILSYCKPTDLQLTPNNDYIASMPSMFQPLPFLLQSTSSSVIPVSSSSTLSSSLSPFHSPYNLPSSVYPSVPFSNHLRPSYCSFSSHSLKPIPSVKPYLSSNRAHLESSRIMLDSVNTKSFNQTTTSNALSTTITTATMNNAAIITDKTGDCAYHQSEQLNSTLLHHASGDSLSNQDSKFSFLHPPVFHSSSLKTSAIVENISDNNNSLTNLIADLFPTSSSNIPQTCLIPSSTSLTCRNVSQLTQTSTVSSAQLPSNNLNDNLSNNYENGMLITNSNSNGSGNGSTSTSTTSCITNINDDLTIDKKLPNLNIENSSASNTSESSNADEKCTSLPRFNLRYTNVLHYPKYSSRKNSGFERRLKHTGLILDAKSTLRLLRKFLQPFVNRDFDQLIKKYMDDFILLAVNNIRDVLGEQSVSENDLTKFRQSLIHRAAVRYFPDLPQRDFINHQGTRSNPSPKLGITNLKSKTKSKSSRGRKTPWLGQNSWQKSKVTTNNNNIQCDKHNEGLSYEKNSLVEADYRQFINTLSNQSVTSSAIHASNNISKDLPHSSNQNIHNNDSNTCKNTSSRLSRKKCTQIKNTMNNFTTKNSNVMKFTFDQNTHFALGSSANTWLGMGTARGRIYSKHPELFRYICDNEDKAWLVQTGLIISPGVKAYLVHAEQVHQIATQQINSYSSKADIEKLRTFKLPYWFLQKVKTVASRHSFFVHVISTELESTKNEIEKNIQDNSSSVDRPFASPFIQSSSSSMSLSNISQFKLDDSTSLSNPMETNHYTSHNIITTIPSSRKILNSPVIFSSSSPSALSLASSSSVTSKYSLTASSSVQECHDMDNNQDSNNNNSNVLLNRNYTKSNWKSTNSYSKTMSIDYADQNNNNNLVNEIQSLPSPNPPTLERFDYTTNR